VSAVYVCNLLELPAHAGTLRPSRLVSLVTTEEQPPTPEGIPLGHHHRVEVHDISEPLDGCILAEPDHVAALIRFLDAWEHRDGPVLIHCVAGISRSTAAALIALVLKAGGREAEAAAALREAAPHAQPNRRLVALADALLGCEGRLIAAREQMGPGEFQPFGPLVRLPLLP